MPHVTHISLFSCVLLVACTSCGAPYYQTSVPQGYGEIPPGEAWVAVNRVYQSPSREMVYYDPKTIHRNGTRVTLWQLTDYKMMQGNAPFGMFMMSPHRFFSTKSHKEFDCAHNRVRLLASSEFSQHMGTGTHNAVVVEQGDGQPVELGTINQALWDVACGVAALRKDWHSMSSNLVSPCRSCDLVTSRYSSRPASGVCAKSHRFQLPAITGPAYLSNISPPCTLCLEL